MKSFQLFRQEKGSFLHDIQEDVATPRLKEGIVWDWVQKKFSILRSLIFKLKFGETKIQRLSFDAKSLNEGFITEAGDWHANVCGVYAEKWAVWSLVNEMHNNNLSVDTSLSETKKYARDYGKLLKRSAADGVSHLNKDKQKLSQVSISFIDQNLDSYEAKGKALGKRIFYEQITDVADSAYCHYEIVHSGSSDAGVSTADLKVHKFSKGEMKEEFRYSLKAYMNSGQKTKGTEKDPFGLLGLMMGIPKLGAASYRHKSKEFERMFGKDLSAYAESSTTIFKWVTNRKKEIKKNGEVSPYGLDVASQAKLEAAQKFGHEIIDLQNEYWQKLFELAIKKEPLKAKKAVLQLLDLGENFSVLITAGMDKKGQIQTWKSASPELQRIMSIQDDEMDRLDIKLISSKRALKPIEIKSGLAKAIGKKTKRGSNLQFAFYIDGVEVYRVTSQLKINGRAQFDTKCGKDTQRYEFDGANLQEFLDVKDNKTSTLIDKEIKKPGSTTRKKRISKEEANSLWSKAGLLMFKNAGNDNKLKIKISNKYARAKAVKSIMLGMSPKKAIEQSIK